MGQLIENTLLGGVLIMLTALGRRVLRGRVSPNLILAMWLLCAVRLLTPVEIGSPVSVYGLWRGPGVEVADRAPDLGDETPVKAWDAGTEHSETADGTGMAGSTGAKLPEGVNEPAGTKKERDAFGWGRVVGAVYATVTAGMALWMEAAYARTRRRVLALPELGLESAETAAMPKRARLKYGSIPGAPLTFGVVRPYVVLTPGLEGENLRFVVAHEAVHARRGDNMWHYLAAICVCIHWFNPAVWLMAALIRRDVELSCDRAVVAGAEGDIRAGYANAIITMSTSSRGAFSLGFGRKRAEERIIGIMKYKKMTIAGAIAGVIAVGTAAVVLASSPVGAGAAGEDMAAVSRGPDVSEGVLGLFSAELPALGEVDWSGDGDACRYTVYFDEALPLEVDGKSVGSVYSMDLRDGEVAWNCHVEDEKGFDWYSDEGWVETDEYGSECKIYYSLTDVLYAKNTTVDLDDGTSLPVLGDKYEGGGKGCGTTDLCKEYYDRLAPLEWCWNAVEGLDVSRVVSVTVDGVTYPVKPGVSSYEGGPEISVRTDAGAGVTEIAVELPGDRVAWLTYDHNANAVSGDVLSAGEAGEAGYPEEFAAPDESEARFDTELAGTEGILGADAVYTCVDYAGGDKVLIGYYPESGSVRGVLWRDGAEEN